MRDVTDRNLYLRPNIFTVEQNFSILLAVKYQKIHHATNALPMLTAISQVAWCYKQKYRKVDNLLFIVRNPYLQSNIITIEQDFTILLVVKDQKTHHTSNTLQMLAIISQLTCCCKEKCRKVDNLLLICSLISLQSNRILLFY